MWPDHLSNGIVLGIENESECQNEFAEVVLEKKLKDTSQKSKQQWTTFTKYENLIFKILCSDVSNEVISNKNMLMTSKRSDTATEKLILYIKGKIFTK